MLCNPWAVWQLETATRLRYGSGLNTAEMFAGRAGTRLMRLGGHRVDVRDAESIAEEFLERGTEALRDVPGGYQGFVADKVLEVQESRAESGEAETLRATRTERRNEVLRAFKRKSQMRGR